MNLYPLKFTPIYKELIWGGNKLNKVLNKDCGADKKIGESWELVDLPQNASVITNGEFAGKTIGEILQKYPQQILGKPEYKPPFGLLIKFIDANDVLSVQVHPDAEAAKKLPNARIKTECWYIISAEPRACIYKGLKDGVTKQQFAEAIKDGSCAKLLKKVEVSVGQCHFLPAGTVHAIGAGCLIAEIQTPSDTTYRVFDWNRLQDGKPRQLHIEQALECIHFDQSSDNLSVQTTGRLVDCEYFKVDKFTDSAAASNDFLSGDLKVLVIISGCGKIIADNCEPVNFESGQTIMLGASLAGRIEFNSDCQYLQAMV